MISPRSLRRPPLILCLLAAQLGATHADESRRTDAIRSLGLYAWYQLAFDQRVIEIYQRGGVDFLRQVQARFLRGRPPLNGAQVLDKLETMSPGWKTWSARVEARNVSAKGF
jgi:hypothetical protein